jgi:hypothetical protein
MAMSRRYGMLIVAVLAGVLAVSLLARRRPAAPRAPVAAAPAPSVELALVFEGGRLTPAASAVPKGHLVKLTVTNHDRAPLALSLAGYETRVTIPQIAPGAEWSGSFTADLPGEGFAWLVHGQPAGRLAVTGSHLEEGHR